jgi:hypothetical protein
MSATRHPIFMRIHGVASSRRSRSLAARKKRSFLARAVVAGFGQARRVEFDRITAFVASGGKETTNNAGQGQNDTAHMSAPGQVLPSTREVAAPGGRAAVPALDQTIKIIGNEKKQPGAMIPIDIKKLGRSQGGRPSHDRQSHQTTDRDTTANHAVSLTLHRECWRCKRRQRRRLLPDCRRPSTSQFRRRLRRSAPGQQYRRP